MTSQMTASDLKARILAVLDEVAAGQSVEVTKRGRPVAMLVPMPGRQSLRGVFEGAAISSEDDDLLFASGEIWEAE